MPPASSAEAGVPAPSGNFARLLGFITGSSRTRWLLWGGLAALVLPYFFSCPLFPVPNPSIDHWARQAVKVVERKIADPWHDYTREFPPESNEAKRNFRVLIPLIAHVTGTGMTGVHVTSVALHAVFILCLLLAAERASGSRAIALGVTLTIVGTQVGTMVWRDTFFWFDNCAHAFIALALVATRAWTVGAAVLLGLFVDERVLLGVPLVMLYHAALADRRSVLVAPIGAVIAYFALRILFTLTLGLQNPLRGVVELSLLIQNIPTAPAVTWFMLEGGWLIVGAAVWHGWNSTRHLAIGLLAIAALVVTGSAQVGDFTRSTSYGFAATLLAIALLRRTRSEMSTARLGRIVGVASAVSVLIPNGVAIGDSLMFESSLPVRALLAALRSLQ